MITYLKSRISSLSGNLHLYVILLAILCLSFFNKYLILLLIIYIIYLYKSKRSLYILFILILLCFISFKVRETNIEFTSSTYSLTILNSEEVDSYYKATALIKGRLVTTYTNEKYSSGTVLNVSGYSKEIEKPSYEGDFNFSNYLKANSIKAQFKIKEIYSARQHYGVFTFREKILNFYSSKLSGLSLSYMKSLIFSIDDFSEDFTKNVRSLGIGHIFAISGMHVSLLVVIINFFLKRRGLDTDKINLICFLVAFFYSYLALFTIGLVRVVLGIFLTNLKDKFDIDLSSLDILSLSFIILVLYNPFYITRIGFILSYLMTFIIRIGFKLTYSKNKIVLLYKTTMLCTLFSLPVIMNINHEVSLITVLIAPLIILLFSSVIYPLTLSNLIFYKVSFLSNIVYKLFNNSINIFDSLNILKLRLPYLNIYLILLYFLLLFLLVKSVENKKIKVLYLGFLITYVFILTNIIYLNPYNKVTFIDCGDGDATLIELAYNKGNILIDANEGTYDFLLSKNIRRIDYMILTHSHTDHTFDSMEILSNLKVSSTILSKYDTREDLSSIISNSNKAYYFKDKNFINFSNIKLFFIGPLKKSNNLNNISLCILVKINKTTILFTGDAETEEETDIGLKYGKLLESDIYQVGHHGSDTSSSLAFIDLVKPKVSIVSSAKYSIHGFPMKTTLDTLSKSRIYKTSTSGNIEIIINEDSYTVKPFKN